jgi:hypothetical protein
MNKTAKRNVKAPVEVLAKETYSPKACGKPYSEKNGNRRIHPDKLFELFTATIIRQKIVR